MIDYYDIIYSSFSALVARIICHPLDTLKTQIQGGSASGGLIRGFKQLKDQGIGAFYKGLPVTFFIYEFRLHRYLVFQVFQHTYFCMIHVKKN